MLGELAQFLSHPPLYAVRVMFVIGHVLFLFGGYVSWNHTRGEDLPFRCMITFFGAAGAVALSMCALTFVTALVVGWNYVLTGA